MCADFNARHISQAHTCTTFIRTKNDAAEFVFRCETVLGRNRRGDFLPLLERERADRATGRLGILFPDRSNDGAGRKVVGREPFRIEPDAHRIFRTEKGDIANASDAAQFIDHLGRCDVTKVGSVQIARLGRKGDDKQEACVRLPHRDTLAPHFFGQARLDRAQPVLHFGLRNIDVSAGFEGQRDCCRTVRTTGRGHVEKTLDPVQLLLDHLSHVLLECFGIGTRVNDIDRQ